MDNSSVLEKGLSLSNSLTYEPWISYFSLGKFPLRSCRSSASPRKETLLFLTELCMQRRKIRTLVLTVVKGFYADEILAKNTLALIQRQLD